MKTKSFTIKRETNDIFVVSGNFPYWSDGASINARVAFDDNHKLSSIKAQSIDRENGLSYLLVNPISFSNISLTSAAGGLRIGESETVSIA